MEKDISTEEKIKEAARQIFQEKGYGQARTRDIAEKAGINLALLNYYFRSKEKLFDIIMEESVREIFSIILKLINDTSTTLSEKIDIAVNHYLDALQKNPNLPLFVLSEVQANPQKLMTKIGVPSNILQQGCFYFQLQEQIRAKDINVMPLHIIINMISMTIFPVVAKPLVVMLHDDKSSSGMYDHFINERRKLIPQWIKAMLKLEE